MSGAFVSLVFDSVRNVPANALLTLLSLADRANKAHGGRAWPSLQDIATRTNRQERQVRADLRTLEAAGWLERVGTGSGGRGRATTYQLNLEAMLLSTPPEKAQAHLQEMRKIPGILLPGFRLYPEQIKAAVDDTKPGSPLQKPGSQAPETRQYTAPEPELVLEPELKSTGSGTGSVARANPEPHDIGIVDVSTAAAAVLKKLKGEPERRPRHMTQAEQVAYAKSRKMPLPANFGISEQVAKWAAANRYDRLPEYLEAFIGKARANGYVYVDWDEAFMNSIREDWGKVRERPAPGGGASKHVAL